MGFVISQVRILPYFNLAFPSYDWFQTDLLACEYAASSVQAMYPLIPPMN